MLTSYHWGRHGSVWWWMAEIVMSKLPGLKVEGRGRRRFGVGREGTETGI